MGLRGLVPPRQLSLEVQAKKVLRNLGREQSAMSKHIYLSELHDRNEILFYRVLIDNMKALAPIVYTPTVGQVCKEFGSQFRRARGMYISSADRGKMSALLYNWPRRDVQVIVVTDGSRILGLGDLGSNGMGIPIGKLALYVAAGGIHPSRVLPIQLDFGTNNKELLADEYYLGMQHPRLKGDEYFQLVDEFMAAVKARYPRALVQFEDFSSDVAATLLGKYRKSHLTFNDDIQGTGAVCLAGVLGALRAQSLPTDALTEQRVVVAGAGSAGLGVATTLMQGMIQQGASMAAAASSFWVVDQGGLLTGARASAGGMTPGQAFFARRDVSEPLSLLETVKRVKPTMLLGLTACGGLFTEEVVREMAKHVARPIVFPLSNPTSKAECSAEQAFQWTDGRAIMASGSPFDPVPFGEKTLFPSQCNK